MRPTRPTAVLVATALATALVSLGLGPVPVAQADPSRAPAPAAANLETTTTLTMTEGLPALQNSTVRLRPAVVTADGQRVEEGTVTLFVKTATSSRWRLVTTVDVSEDQIEVTAKKNSRYRLDYSGHLASSTEEDSLEPSESRPLEVTVRRYIEFVILGRFLGASIGSDYKRKPVVLERRRGTRWTAWRTTRTDDTGWFKVWAPHIRNVPLRITLRATKSFVAARDPFTIF